jgi:hypothetical protein
MIELDLCLCRLLSSCRIFLVLQFNVQTKSCFSTIWFAALVTNMLPVEFVCRSPHCLGRAFGVYPRSVLRCEFGNRSIKFLSCVHVLVAQYCLALILAQGVSEPSVPAPLRESLRFARNSPQPSHST